MGGMAAPVVVILGLGALLFGGVVVFGVGYQIASALAGCF